MTEHRWSGWPGAWCLDCGAEDQTEICLATEHPGITFHRFPDGMEDISKCPIHQNKECSEPGSNRHNPYVKHDEVSA